MKKTDRCTGHCCERFTLPFGPEEIQTRYMAWKNSGGGNPFRMNGDREMATLQDIHLVAPMVVYLGFAEEPTPINPTNETLLKKPGPKHHLYRCKHFDAKARVCTIYEIRPAMCREYPYGHLCRYDGCTWASHREKKQTPKERRDRLRVLKDGELRARDPGGDSDKKEIGGIMPFPEDARPKTRSR